MKYRFVKFFLIFFLVTFVILNGRFLYASTRFWLSGSKTAPANKTGISNLKTDEAVLIIEKIGVHAPIIFSAESSPKKIYEELENGVINYPGLSKPGNFGTAIILGHSSAYPWYKGSYGSVFALLGQLKIGDKVIVRYGDNRVFTYSVKQSLVFSPFKKDLGLLENEKKSTSSIVLISCWPIGTNYKRIAIQAELI